MADDLGRDLLGLYDPDAAIEINTPNIDRLAAEGVVFHNAWASPLCVVTRAELVTGRYPFHNGMLGHAEDHLIGGGHMFLDPKYQRSFAQPLKQAGYATALAGKWHVNHIKPGNQPRVLRAFGFDEWMAADHDNAAPARVFTHDGGKTLDAFPPDALADFAIDFITRHREQPFFLYWPMHLVHRPLVATPLKPDAEKSIEKQIAMTEYADHLVGRLVQAVDELGLRDDTIVFFSGDNGSIQSRRPSRRGGKGSLTEAGVNVPFIVSGGPVVRRGRTRALTDFSDVLPTLAEFAGIAVPASWAVDGVSIAPFLTGRSEDTPREWIAAAAAVKPTRDTGKYNFLPSQPGPARDRYGWRAEVMGLVVRDRRFKLWDYPQGLQALFDLQHDPHEQRNLWTSRDPAVVAAKRRLLAVRDRFPRVPAPLRSDPVTDHYGLFAHWRFDGQTEVGGLRHFPDTVGGYDARYEPRAPDGERAGKFGGALPASATPGEAAHFIDFLAGTGSQRQFRRWRRQSLTLSAWVRLAGPLAREWHLLHAASDRPFNAGLHRVIDGVEEHPPLVIATNRSRNGQPRIEVAGGVQPLAPGERGHVTVTASNLDPSQTYLVRLTYAGRGLGSRPNCAYRVEDSTSGVFSGVRSHTETFTVYGCPDAAEAALALTVTRAGELALQLATTRGGRANRVKRPAAGDGRRVDARGRHVGRRRRLRRGGSVHRRPRRGARLSGRRVEGGARERPAPRLSDLRGPAVPRDRAGLAGRRGGVAAGADAGAGRRPAHAGQPLRLRCRRGGHAVQCAAGIPRHGRRRGVGTGG